MEIIWGNVLKLFSPAGTLGDQKPQRYTGLKGGKKRGHWPGLIGGGEILKVGRKNPERLASWDESLWPRGCDHGVRGGAPEFVSQQ